MKWSLSIVFILFVLPIYAENFFGILNENDFEMQQSDSERGPALSSANDEWKSYNRWQCFNVKHTKLICAEYDYGQNKVPSIIVQSSHHRYEFDLPLEDKYDCQDTLKTWKRLIMDNQEICIYGAYMPAVNEVNYPLDWSLWYIDTIKTSKGYWSIAF